MIADAPRACKDDSGLSAITRSKCLQTQSHTVCYLNVGIKAAKYESGRLGISPKQVIFKGTPIFQRCLNLKIITPVNRMRIRIFKRNPIYL